jgi:hypothetical protein
MNRVFHPSESACTVTAVTAAYTVRSSEFVQEAYGHLKQIFSRAEYKTLIQKILSQNV